VGAMIGRVISGKKKSSVEVEKVSREAVIVRLIRHGTLATSRGVFELLRGPF